MYSNAFKMVDSEDTQLYRSIEKSFLLKHLYIIVFVSIIIRVQYTYMQRGTYVCLPEVLGEVTWRWLVPESYAVGASGQLIITALSDCMEKCHTNFRAERKRRRT